MTEWSYYAYKQPWAADQLRVAGLLEQAFLTWLAPDNFDDQGKQHLRLSDLTRPILKKLSDAVELF